jgi:cullin 3
MDRTFVKHVNKTPVFDRGLQIWTAEVVRHKEIGPRLRGLCLELVAKERGGEVVDRLAFRGVTKMLLELGTSVYISDFETPFLEESTQYFKCASRFLEVPYDRHLFH